MLSDLIAVMPIWLIAMIAATVVLAIYFVTLWIAGTRYARQRAYLAQPTTEETHKPV